MLCGVTCSERLVVCRGEVRHSLAIARLCSSDCLGLIYFALS